MATHVVPGADPKNNDQLRPGCWAEHLDQSLIYVKEITKADFVIFDMYAMTDGNDPVFYTDVMPIEKFNHIFSFDLSQDVHPPIKWLWHDKTQFPWDRVLHSLNHKRKLHDGSVVTMSATQKVASALRIALSGVLTPNYIKELREGEKRGTPKASQTIFNRIKNAIGKLRD